jgi:hypothetical protein
MRPRAVHWLFIFCWIPLIQLNGCVCTPEQTAPGKGAAEEALSIEAAITPVLETDDHPGGYAARTLKQIEDTWGIQVKSLRRTAAGRMLDFRFKVLDPDKAAHLLKREDKPYLLDQASGKKLMVPSMPKIGPLRPTAVKPEANRVYFILFANPQELVKRGSLVSILIGNIRIEDLMVE